MTPARSTAPSEELLPQGGSIADQWASHLASQIPQWRLGIDDLTERGGFLGFYGGRVVQEFILEPVQGVSTAWLERDVVGGGLAVVGAVFKPARAVDKVADAGAGHFNDLVAAAKKLYPKKARRIEEHHIEPLYLGGARSGSTAPLNAAYHQLITNEFRRLAPYGSEVPSAARVQEIMRQVYEKYPLPPGY